MMGKLVFSEHSYGNVSSIRLKCMFSMYFLKYLSNCVGNWETIKSQILRANLCIFLICIEYVIRIIFNILSFILDILRTKWPRKDTQYKWCTNRVGIYQTSNSFVLISICSFLAKGIHRTVWKKAKYARKTYLKYFFVPVFKFQNINKTGRNFFLTNRSLKLLLTWDC